MQTVLDPIRQQARRDLVALLTASALVLPLAIGGAAFAGQLYQGLFHIAADTPLAGLSIVPVVLMFFIGLLVGALVGSLIWELVMKQFLTKDEMYKWAVAGGYVPVLTPLSIAFTRRVLGDMKPARTQVGLLTQLDSIGFYKYGGTSGPALASKSGSRAVADNWLFDPSTLRFYPLKEEDLANGGFSDFVKKLQPFLEREGVSLNGMREEPSDKGLFVVADVMTYLLYTKRQAQDGSINVSSLVRSLAIVSDLLRTANSAERPYVMSDGTEAYVAFLTSEMYGLLLAGPFPERSHKPVSASSLMTNLTMRL